MLTGQTRHRRSWLGKFIMQVEFTQRGKRRYSLSHPCPSTRQWRDATDHDVSVLAAMERNRQDVYARSPLYLVR